jgi:Circularly permutated YpsA SLOG family
MLRPPSAPSRRIGWPPHTVVSGGQSGVDRAALDAALAAGLAIGGWCPRGRWAEDGRLAGRYPLRETPLARVVQRTRWNVRDSDATLVLVPGRPRGGTLATLRAAAGRPLLVLGPEFERAGRRARAFLIRHRVRRLNVAGPRASEAPGIYDAARCFLDALFRDWTGRRNGKDCR